MGTSPGREAGDDPPRKDGDPEYVEPSATGLRSKDHTRAMMEKTYLAIFGPEGSLAVYARKLKYVRTRRR